MAWLEGTNEQASRIEESRLGEARTHVARNRIAEAEAIYRDLLLTTPDLPEALNFVAMCAFKRGEFASAQRGLERAVQREPAQPETWTNLGIVHLAKRSNAEALDALDRAIALNPVHFIARLYRGMALERLGRFDAAAAGYYGALVGAQSRGQWQREATTPVNLRPLVKHANQFVKLHRKRASLELLKPLRDRFGPGAIERVERGLDIYLALREANYPDPRQRCKFFYVPGLTAQPYYPRESFPWQTELEKHADEIREELRAVLQHPAGVEPFLGTNDNKLLKEQKWLIGARGEAQWNSFFFHRRGEVFEQNTRRCPHTSEALNALPLVHIRGYAPEVLFSILTPGSHILPHHGVTNTRLITHLPLIIPAGCALRVGGVEHAWREGRCVTFDDTFEHEAWNRSDKVRAVMILDAWHPDLSEAEREAIALLVGDIGDFNRGATAATPPDAQGVRERT